MQPLLIQNVKEKTRDATMYTKVKKPHEKGNCYPITIDVATDMAYGENVEDFMGYIVLQGRNKVSILIDSWHDIDDDLKINIWTDITVCILNLYDLFYKYI